MCGDFHDVVVIAIPAVDGSLVNDWHDHERDLERQSWVTAAAAEQESRFGRVVVITAVGQFDQNRLAERGAALQWGLNGRTPSSFLIECIGCEELSTSGTKASGTTSRCFYLRPIQRRM